MRTPGVSSPPVYFPCDSGDYDKAWFELLNLVDVFNKAT